MKRIMTIIALATVVYSCRPEYSDIGPKYSLTTGINGSWKVSKVTITDLTLPAPESRDISDFFMNDNSLQIEFDATAKTYAVTDPNVLGNPFGSMGTFAFDAEDFPTAMTLYSSDQDTIDLSLENMVRSIDHEMAFTLEKDDCASKYIGYTYTFNRQ